MKYFFLPFLLIFISGKAQDPNRFKDEIAGIQKKYDTLWDASKETFVFTGSSSVRMWKDLEQWFPNIHIVNTGFGGSQASDLLAYPYELILRFKPKMVFIYEGDNDIFDGERPNTIVDEMAMIISGIKRNSPQTKIVLISAKPSIARWSFRGKYKRLNRKLNALANEDGLVEFANVWDTMLDGKKVRQDIFIEDGLHMNNKGYELWYEVIKGYMK